MRKVFTLIVVGFIIIAGILVMVMEAPSDNVSILTINRQYSRLLTESEVISIPVYISETKTFLVDLGSVQSISLENEYQKLEAVLTEIRDANSTERLGETEYSLYYFDIGFPNVEYTDYFLEFDDCYMNVVYKNDDAISLEIGDVSLRFSEVNTSNHLNLYRMFCLTDEYQDALYTSAIIIGIQNLTGFDIEITGLDIGSGNAEIDMALAKYVLAEEEQTTDLDILLGHEYQLIGECDGSDGLSLDEDNLIVLPIKYRSEVVCLNRMPLIITYTYQNQEYQYIIDDFQYYSVSNRLGDNNGKLREYSYHYQ